MNNKTRNIKVISAILVVLVIMMAGCKKKDLSTESSPSDNTAANDTPEVEIVETFDIAPGTAVDIFSDPEFTETVETEEDKENTETDEKAVETEPVDDVETEESIPENSEEIETQPESTEKELMEYERYLKMSGDEQMQLISSFGSVEAFFEWLNNAKAEYEAANPEIEIGDGAIDLEEISGNK